MVELFEVSLDAAFDDNDTALAASWIEDARPLATVLNRALDNRMTLAIERAGRRLELSYRQDLDRQHLATFLRREEQVKAFEDLMNGPDDRWAVHFIGAGGVGKTMLVRYISAELQA